MTEEMDEGMMSGTNVVEDEDGTPRLYEIRIKGHLDQRWAKWFEGMSITVEANGETLLAGPVTDQSALHGLLRTVRDLGIPLISVMRLEST